MWHTHAHVCCSNSSSGTLNDHFSLEVAYHIFYGSLLCLHPSFSLNPPPHFNPSHLSHFSSSGDNKQNMHISIIECVRARSHSLRLSVNSDNFIECTSKYFATNIVRATFAKAICWKICKICMPNIFVNCHSSKFRIQLTDERQPMSKNCCGKCARKNCNPVMLEQ